MQKKISFVKIVVVVRVVSARPPGQLVVLDVLGHALVEVFVLDGLLDLKS